MIRPKQKISTAEKLKGSWIEENAFYWDSVCKDAIDQEEALVLYKAANGELIDEAYTYATNPLNTENENFKRFPAKIRNIDIINSIVMMLMGEKRKRGLNYTAIARNSNIESIRKTIKENAYSEAMYAEFINSFISYSEQIGNPVDIERVQSLSMEEVENRTSKIQDDVAIKAQQVIDYIVDYNKSFEIFLEGWFHFIVTARAFSYRDVYRDEVIHEAVSPLEMKFYAFSHVSNLEDCEAHVRRKRMSINQIIDKFQGVEGFTEDVEEELNAKLGYTVEAHTEIKHNTSKDPGKVAFTEMWNRLWGTEGYVYSDEDGIEVKHVVWTSLVKVGLLSHVTVFGELIQEEVDEDYTPTIDESIDWVWVEQKWECFIIDDKHVVGGQPLMNCTGSYFSPKAKKSVYNGKILGMKHTNPKSIVAKGLDFQIKYNLIHYYIERLLAKNLDSLTVLPLSLIETEKGAGLEGAMYYAHALGMLFVDDSNPKAAVALNAVKSVNSNLGSSLQAYYSLLQLIKQEWEESIGVTGPRKGQMNSSDGKAVTENAVFRSSIMTEEYFAQFEDMQESDLNFCLESSKYAFSEGKKEMYLNRDREATVLEVDGEFLNYYDFLVRISSSGKEIDKLNQVQSLAQAFAQNADGRFTPALRAIQGNNISQIIEVMEQLENEIQASIEAQQQADRESQEKVAQLNLEAEQMRDERERYKIDTDSATKIEVARIQAESKTLGEFQNPVNAESDADRVVENSMKREIELRKIEADERKSVRDTEAKKYQADQSLKIARENKSM